LLAAHDDRFHLFFLHFQDAPQRLYLSLETCRKTIALAFPAGEPEWP